MKRYRGCYRLFTVRPLDLPVGCSFFFFFEIPKKKKNPRCADDAPMIYGPLSDYMKEKQNWEHFSFLFFSFFLATWPRPIKEKRETQRKTKWPTPLNSSRLRYPGNVTSTRKTKQNKTKKLGTKPSKVRSDPEWPSKATPSSPQNLGKTRYNPLASR